MSVYYKFNSELNYSFVDFDGLHISVSDLKKSILHQKRLGKSADFDLLISNAQTKEEYKEENQLIPKNTSLIVARVPISNQNKKSWELTQSSAERPPVNPSAESINHDITRMNGTEDDKIQAMIMQSTSDYDPTNYQRVRGSTQTGDVPQHYRCHKCNKPGHWIKNCPLNVPGKDHHHFKTRPENKKMTGIPRSLRDNIGTESQETTQNQFIEEKIEIPEDLVCAICKGIFKDAVMTPCCGSSFCDECVRTALLESEDNECPAPDCREKGTSPGSLIPNRFLRNAVADFHAKSSNVLSREKKSAEDPAPQEYFEEPAQEESMPAEVEEESVKLIPLASNDQIPTKENEEVKPPNAAEKDSESDDDDNITVTVPPAYQQSRGASFRDSRLRRVPSHGMGDYHENFSHSSSKSHQDDESYEEESSESYQRQPSGSMRPNHQSYEHSSGNTPQGITTLVGDDKGGNQNYHHSSASNQNMPHGDPQNVYSSQHQQPPPLYNQNQHQNHSGMMPQMHSHSMYSQPPFQHHGGPYYPPNQQLRPMRFDPHGNYQAPPRHHHAQPMMRPSMHDNFNVRHQRPPMNHLANAVTQNIQQRYGTGFIDDPLEAFNRIMREKEMRKERYRRSPIHNSERRSRSFDRKRSPHPYSPDNRRPKNYSKTRKRSRSFKSKSDSRSRSRSRNPSARGRSKSRSYSPRYRRKENVQNKDRRDERHRRSPDRRGNHHNNRNSRSRTFKGEASHKQGLRDVHDNHQHHDRLGNQHENTEQNFEPYTKDSNAFETSHNLDEQPPPPGDETEMLTLQAPPVTVEQEVQAKKSKTVESDHTPKEVNGSSKTEGEGKRVENDQKKTDHHYHHKKSRDKNYEKSLEDKKIRDKKKRKKSREHEKKKSKKDRKDRSEREKDKKSSSKTGSVEKTPEASAAESADVEKLNHTESDDTHLHSLNRTETPDRHKTPEAEDDPIDEPIKSRHDSSLKLKRSDSFLDINPNVDLGLDEWIAPEVSKWEREEIKSLENNEVDVGNGDVKRNPEERVTSEILKRAENAIFAKAISDIRPMENKKFRTIQEHDSLAAGLANRKENSPISLVIKQTDIASRLQGFQVSVPANDSGTRSIELKTSDGSRKKSPIKISIKNRLGKKIIEKKSKSRTPSRSPKRKIQSDCTKVVRSSRDQERNARGSQLENKSSRDRRPSPENQRNRQLSSTIKVSRDAKDGRDSGRNSRSRYTSNNRRRSPTPNDRRASPRKRSRQSRSRTNSRDRSRRDHRNVDRSSGRAKEPTRNEEKSSKAPDHSLSENEKAKSSRHNIEAPPAKKRSRAPSTSSSSSESSGSQKHSKRHTKQKGKKKSRSLSEESNGNSKRKKSKKEKKVKKKKKSRK